MKKTRKIKNFILDPLVQFQFIFEVLLLIIATNVLIIILTFIFLQNILNEINKLGISSDKMEIISHFMGNYLMSLFFLILFFTGIIVFYLIVRSHRVVGAIYAIRKYIRENLLQGKYQDPLILRKEDYLHELAGDINLLREELWSKDRH